MAERTFPLMPERETVLPPEQVWQLDIPAGYHPLSSCYLQTVPVDLAQYGYVEEEYIIRSTGSIYLWPKDAPRPVVRAANAPYCSRFLVRKPADPAKFSGVVTLEAFNNGGKISHPPCAWGSMYDHMLQSGDAWIGVEVQHAGFRMLRTYDPARYEPFDLAFTNPVPPEERGPLGWHVLRDAAKKRGFVYSLELPDDFEKGFIFDEFFQIAALCKRGDPGDPFHGYGVQKVCIASVFDINAFVAGFHPYKRLPDGAPVFDGYLKYMSGAGGELSREADMWWHDDPRSMARCDVPVIRIETAGDLRGELPHPSWGSMRRMPDSDEPGAQSRWYEIAGLSVSRATPGNYAVRANAACYEAVGVEPPKNEDPTLTPMYNFAGKHIVTGAYRNLKAWMLEGTPPPRAEVIALEGSYPDTVFKTDELGNHIGGVRTPYVDVPVAAYDDLGGVTLFPPEQLRQLYGTREEYLRRVQACCAALEQERWITPEGAAAMAAQAASVEF